jgi:hypothetical protein
LSLKSSIKRALLPGGARPHTVLTGAFRGLEMEMDPQSSMQFWAGLYERETYRWIARFGAGCASGIDVGAAKGEVSLFLLKRTAATRVLAFEPSPEHDATFSRNLALNGLADDGRLGRHAEFAGAGQAGSVRLDAFVAELPSPVFAKIDVDGAEGEVIEGMSELFAQRRVRLLLETHSVELEKRCVELLQRSGCRTRIVDNAWWRRLLRDQRPIGFNRWLVATNDPDCSV